MSTLPGEPGALLPFHWAGSRPRGWTSASSDVILRSSRSPNMKISGSTTKLNLQDLRIELFDLSRSHASVREPQPHAPRPPNLDLPKTAEADAGHRGRVPITFNSMRGSRCSRWIAVRSLRTLLAAGHAAMTGWTKRRQLSSVAGHLFPVASATARWPWCRALSSAAKTPKKRYAVMVFSSAVAGSVATKLPADRRSRTCKSCMEPTSGLEPKTSYLPRISLPALWQ